MNGEIRGAIIAGLSAIVGGLVTGFFDFAVKAWRRPKLKLDFNENSDKVEAAWKGEHAFDGLVIRVSLRNVGRETAHGCRVFITSMAEQHGPKEVATGFLDSRQTPWAGSQFGVQSLPRGISFYSDILRINKQYAGWHFPFERSMARDQDLLLYRGTYILGIAAPADNAKGVILRLAVNYDKDWNLLKAWKVD